MTTSSAERAGRFGRFAERRCGLTLEPFQAEIVETVEAHRETLVLLPRGNGKTTLAAALGLFALITRPGAHVYCAAASRDQARLLLETATRMVQDSAELAAQITVRHRELRHRGGYLRTLSSDGPRAHGLEPDFVIVDELHAHRDEQLYVALRTTLGKRPGSRLVSISTAGYDPETVLGRLRTAALALPDVTRDGAHVVADDGRGGFAMLEWSVPPEGDPTDVDQVLAANPATFVTRDWLEEQMAAPGLHPLEVMRYHANIWTPGRAAWLPPGAWQACQGDATIAPGERVWMGVDVGGSRAATALVTVTEDLRVHCETWQGDDAVLAVAPAIREQAGRWSVVQLAYDPWRFQQSALELEAEGLPIAEYPQNHAMMVPASEGLYAAIVERRLTHDGDRTLAAHILGATAKSTGRGWRLDKSHDTAQIDAAVALAIAVRSAEAPRAQTRPPEVIGWF